MSCAETIRCVPFVGLWSGAWLRCTARSLFLYAHVPARIAVISRSTFFWRNGRCRRHRNMDHWNRLLDELIGLSRGDLEKLLKRLTHHALCKMHRLSWRGSHIRAGGVVPEGKEACDFAVEAIEKSLDGSRQWNRIAHPTLEAHLRAAVDSLISHHVESADNQRGRRLSPTATCAHGSGSRVPGDGADPVQDAIDDEQFNQLRKAAIREIENDEFLSQLFELMEADITQPSEIALLLDCSVDVVNNAKKRLRNRLISLNKPAKPKKKPTRR